MSTRIADPVVRRAVPGVVSLSPDDLDQVEDLPVAKAITNLAHVHQLPRLEHVCRVTKHDGHTIVVLTIPELAAEQWRAALGAPPFTEKVHPTTVQHLTERSCWFGATVRLSYSTV